MKTHAVLLHLVLLAVAVRSADICPDMCVCSTTFMRDQRLDAVVCRGPPDGLLDRLPNTTHDLVWHSLDVNASLGLLDAFMDNLSPQIVHLTINDSRLDTLPSMNLSSQLQTLQLTHNGIENVGGLNAEGLKKLDLSHNRVVLLTDRPFRTLRALEQLDLSANNLSVLTADNFVGLTGLRCLDLSENRLEALNDGVLANLPALQYLNLSRNFLKNLEAVGFDSLPKLQQLDVSWNRLVRIAPGTLHLPNLVRLVLTGNGDLGHANEPTFLVGSGKLQAVDASTTGLSQVPSTLTHSIRTLRLAENRISTIRCGDLDSYPLLQLLDLNSNRLESIEDDALGRLDSLSILYLAQNLIVELPKSLPEHLKVLHIERNRIRKVSKEDMQGLDRLEVLLLNDNKISVVDEEAFAGLNSLITLDLSRNPIGLLEVGHFYGPIALRVLRLSDIDVASQPKDLSFPLTAVEHLTILDLSDSPGLARQLLADTAALAACRDLQELDVSRTQLQTIRMDLLDFLPQLRVLKIDDNPINCTGLEWLAGWMRRQDNEAYKMITCTNPPELWGTPFVDMETADYYQTQQTTRMLSSTTTIRPSTYSSPDEPENITVQFHTNTTRWNTSNGEMSMLSTADHQQDHVVHPGMIILAAGILGTSAALVMLASRFVWRKTQISRQCQTGGDSYETGGGLTTVADLW